MLGSQMSIGAYVHTHQPREFQMLSEMVRHFHGHRSFWCLLRIFEVISRCRPAKRLRFGRLLYNCRHLARGAVLLVFTDSDPALLPNFTAEWTTPPAQNLPAFPTLSSLGGPRMPWPNPSCRTLPMKLIFDQIQAQRSHSVGSSRLRAQTVSSIYFVGMLRRVRSGNDTLRRA